VLVRLRGLFLLRRHGGLVQQMRTARGLQLQAGLGGEMKQPLAHRVTIPTARVPSAARETVAPVENLGALDAEKVRHREERAASMSTTTHPSRLRRFTRWRVSR